MLTHKVNNRTLTDHKQQQPISRKCMKLDNSVYTMKSYYILLFLQHAAMMLCLH